MTLSGELHGSIGTCVFLHKMLHQLHDFFAVHTHALSSHHAFKQPLHYASVDMRIICRKTFFEEFFVKGTTYVAMHMLNALHKITTVWWRPVHIVAANVGGQEHVLAQVVKMWIVEDEDGPTRVTSPVPPPKRGICNGGQVVKEFLLCHALGCDRLLASLTFDVFLDLQDDIAIRKPGRPSKVAFAWQNYIDLPDRCKMPKKSERLQQFVFKARECKGCHWRIMLPNSIACADNIVCKVCIDDEELKNRGCTHPSRHERAAYSFLDSHPPRIPGIRWATEVAAFHKLQATSVALQGSRADIVLFQGNCITHGALRSGLLVYVDGEGHFPWKYNQQGPGLSKAEQQRATDTLVSLAAARHGYRIVRICRRDIHHFLSIVRVAWDEPTKDGWVYVSQQWNTGAHLVLTRQARCAGDG